MTLIVIAFGKNGLTWNFDLGLPSYTPAFGMSVPAPATALLFVFSDVSSEKT